MVRNGAFSHKIDFITTFLENLNLKVQQNRTTGSRVTAILLNGWNFPIGQSGEAILDLTFDTHLSPKLTKLPF